MTIVPAMVTHPLRLKVVVLAATLNVAEPLPDPVAPLVTVIQAKLVDAVHGQPGATVTLLVAVPPAAVSV